MRILNIMRLYKHWDCTMRLEKHAIKYELDYVMNAESYKNKNGFN